MLSQGKIDQIYVDLMRDLKALIEQRGSMAAFCKEHNISRPNLVSCFSESNRSEISVGLYLRACVALGLMIASPLFLENKQLSNLTLKNYLMIDNTSIYHSMMMISNA